MNAQRCNLPEAGRRLARFTLVLAAALGLSEAHARSFRVNMLPNGGVFRCATCHFNPGGGGPRNPFGRAVETRVVPGSPTPFWDTSLAGLDSDGDGATNGEELGDPDGDGIATPGVTVTHPGDPASKPPPPAPIVIASDGLEVQGMIGLLRWTGGKGPFLVQQRTAMGDGVWRDVLTTADPMARVALGDVQGFFRVEDVPGRTVIPLTVWLSGAAVISPVETPGHGLGTLVLDGNTLTYHLPFAGLLDAAIAAHLHGPADSMTNAGVLIPLDGAAGQSGALTGTTVVSVADRENLLSGRTYVNLHTTAHQAGEIRGQVAPVRWRAELSGANLVDPVVTPGSGTAEFELAGNQLFWTLTWRNLTAAATAAHIHGPADPTQNAGVLVPLPGVTGISGTVSGTATLTVANLLHLIDGKTYVNIHTPTHGAGEIRGQIEPAL